MNESHSLLHFGRILDDALAAVDDVLLELVGQHALHWLALVRLGYLLGRVRD